ncbi:TPA: hypothetical protein R4S04_000566 [Enterobacter bugandensis]|nr:hypothetical protein [Enterobacter bugandensis]
MSTITKEWLQKAIKQHESMRDEIPFGLDEDESNTLEALRIALASLEAETVAWLWSNRKHPSEVTLVRPEDDEKAEAAQWSGWSYKALYAEPPAPVSVPDALYQFAEFMAAESIKSGDYPDGWQCKASNAAHEYAQSCRAAMLQGADGNSPVIPDGYCIMPLKLTADNGAKGALCGEFHVQYRIVCQSCVGEGCEDCNHTGGWDAEIPVSWDTIKRIHEAAVETCALPAAPQQEVK